MSRSRKKSPCGGFTCAKSDHWWKQCSSRRLRHLNKMRLADGAEPLKLYEVSSSYNSPKDGHGWFGEAYAASHPKSVRK